MVLLQSLSVGAVGYGLGVGIAAALGYSLRRTELAFRLPWQLLLISGAAILFICLSAAFLSVRKVLKLDPAIVFKG
jgi:putative ABC transport system permease protein